MLAPLREELSTNWSSSPATGRLVSARWDCPHRSTPRSCATPRCEVPRRCPRSTDTPACCTTLSMSDPCAVHPRHGRVRASRSAPRCLASCVPTIRCPLTGSPPRRSCRDARRCRRVGVPTRTGAGRDGGNRVGRRPAFRVRTPHSENFRMPFEVEVVSRTTRWQAHGGQPLQQGAQGPTRPDPGDDTIRTRRRRGGRDDRAPGRHARRTPRQSTDRCHPCLTMRVNHSTPPT